MITINMMCVPQGIGMLRFDILGGQIWTSDCGKFHHYTLELADETVLVGRVLKRYSAHKNPLRILADIYDKEYNDGV